jgi:WD40 repeat protein
MTLNRDGSHLATASAEGTLIKVFCTSSGTSLHEFRRGSTPKQIQNLAFEWEKGDYLTCCSATSDTVHVWRCMPMQTEQVDQSVTVQNTGSYFAKLSTFVSYAGSQWSYAQVRLISAEFKEMATDASEGAIDGSQLAKSESPSVLAPGQTAKSGTASTLMKSSLAKIPAVTTRQSKAVVLRDKSTG